MRLNKTRLSVLVVEELEPLILHSADLSPLTQTAIQVSDLPSQNFSDTSSAINNTTSILSDQNNKRQEIFFIDSNVEGYEKLIEDLTSEQTKDQLWHVVILDAQNSGIDQITEALNQYRNLDAIHIISHGQAGEISVGDTILNGKNLLDNAREISQWGNSLKSDGDLLLYGCDVAETVQGKDFVNQLAQLTGADVDASVDLTGVNTLGGNWLLEYATGEIDTKIASFNYQWVLATYTVTNANDSGAGSLRQAISDANANVGADTINFNIGSGSQTISPLSVLPDITDTVTIDGTSQSGYSAAPIIQLSGTSAAGVDGFTLTAGASGSTIRGLIINQFDNGIEIDGAGNITIQNNYIGTNAAGTAVSGNINSGVYMLNASNITIGGTTAAERNVLSGNRYGVAMDSSTSVIVQGNYIGLTQLTVQI